MFDLASGRPSPVSYVGSATYGTILIFTPLRWINPLSDCVNLWPDPIRADIHIHLRPITFCPAPRLISTDGTSADCSRSWKVRLIFFDHGLVRRHLAQITALAPFQIDIWQVVSPLGSWNLLHTGQWPQPVPWNEFLNVSPIWANGVCTFLITRRSFT